MWGEKKEGEQAGILSVTFKMGQLDVFTTCGASREQLDISFR